MKNEAYDYGQAVRKSQGTKGHVGKGCVSVVFPDGDVWFPVLQDHGL